jgi:hypothetical protein
MLLFLEQALYINGQLISKLEKAELEASREIPSASLKVRLHVKGNEDVLSIKQGDSVLWKAGYKRSNENKAELVEEFRGTITEVTPSRPLEFLARDDMHLLSLKTIKSNLPSMSLTAYTNKLITYLDKPPTVSIDPSVGSISVFENIAGHTARYALWKLTDIKYGCDVYFKGNTLYIESQFDKKSKTPTSMFSYQSNIISSNLKGKGIKTDMGKKPDKGSVLKRLGDDIVVKVISENIKTGIRAERKYGEGTNEKVYYIDNLKPNELAKKAKEIYNDLTGEGFTGSFTTFGYPSVSLNDVIHIYNPDEEQSSGNCIVEKIVKTFDISSATYRQVIYPGKFTEPPKRKPKPKQQTATAQTKPGTQTVIDKIHERYDEMHLLYSGIKTIDMRK